MEKYEKDISEMMKQQTVGFEAVITEINETTNHDFFDDKSFEKRKGLAVSFRIDNKSADPEEWTEFFGMPKPRGFLKSKIGMFTRKYDTYPQISMRVKAEINEDGFFRCVV